MPILIHIVIHSSASLLWTFRVYSSDLDVFLTFRPVLCRPRRPDTLRLPSPLHVIHTPLHICELTSSASRGTSLSRPSAYPTHLRRYPAASVRTVRSTHQGCAESRIRCGAGRAVSRETPGVRPTAICYRSCVKNTSEAQGCLPIASDSLVSTL